MGSRSEKGMQEKRMQLERLKREIGLLPDVVGFDPKDDERLLTGISRETVEGLNRGLKKMHELEGITAALKDPKLKPKALEYVKLKKELEANR